MARISGQSRIHPVTRAELQFLVNQVADQILGPPGGTSAPAAPEAKSVLPALSASELAAVIDHTNLQPEARREDIVLLCEQALTWGFATVCVHSIWVPLVHRILRDTKVKVCTVTGFPTGAVPPAVKRLEAEIALRNGAEEIDMVLPIGLLRSGELDMVRQDIATVAEATAERGAILKVILETATLSEREIAVACALCRLGGAQFVKTSTGLHPAGGARAEQVAWMRKAVGEDLGVKAAGGIRTLNSTLQMLAAGANRIGTSSGVSILSSLKSTTGG